MWPNRKGTTWVSRLAHPSLLPDSHQPSCFLPAANFLESVLPVSLKYAILDAFRHDYCFLQYARNIDAMMKLWMAAASALPYSDDVGQSVVDALLQMAENDQLLPHIPVCAWDWLKKRPLLGPECRGLDLAGHGAIQTVRKRRDVELITSYLFVVWSEWRELRHWGYRAMPDLIREELSGIGAVGHRADLIQRLDYVQSKWRIYDEWYEELRTALLEVDKEATKTLTGMSHSYRPFSAP